MPLLGKPRFSMKRILNQEYGDIGYHGYHLRAGNAGMHKVRVSSQLLTPGARDPLSSHS